MNALVTISGGTILGQVYYDAVDIGALEVRNGKELLLLLSNASVRSLDNLKAKCGELGELIKDAITTKKFKPVPGSLWSATHLADAVEIANNTSVLSDEERALLGYPDPESARSVLRIDMDDAAVSVSVTNYSHCDDRVVEGRLIFESKGSSVEVMKLNPDQVSVIKDECRRLKLKFLGNPTQTVSCSDCGQPVEVIAEPDETDVYGICDACWVRRERSTAQA